MENVNNEWFEKNPGLIVFSYKLPWGYFICLKAGRNFQI